MADQGPRKRPVAKKPAPATRAAPARRTTRPSARQQPRKGTRRGAAGRDTGQGPAGQDTGRGPAGPVGQQNTAGAEAGPSVGAGRANPLEEVLRLFGDFVGSVIGPDADAKVAEALAFLRRRLTGDYEVDLFGFDQEFTENVLLPVFRPLYRHWFRVEVRGIENIPAEGAVLVVANHSGTIAIDSVMTQLAVHDEHPAHRNLRMLGADLVFRLPLISDLARKSGTTLACNEDTERLLASGHVVGVWPEGFKGVGKPFSERYRLQRFGRGGFVSAAVKAGAPIVPCSIVGAEETYPLIGNIAPLARLLGLPYVPVTPTFPWLGPLGLIPLPSKWIIQFGSPIETEELGAAAADDPMLVFDLTDRVRETIQHTLYALLTERGNPFR
jgi:1-acyl-sn-glycerol-3-phosphate acyltransferase